MFESSKLQTEFSRDLNIPYNINVIYSAKITETLVYVDDFVSVCEYKDAYTVTLRKLLAGCRQLHRQDRTNLKSQLLFLE